MTEQLQPLVGDWAIVVGDQELGRLSFEWMAGEKFLVQRWSSDPPEYPDGMAIIGPDESGQGLFQHYFDSRGVHRVYGMSLEDGVWRLWRDDPDFAQRFSATLEGDAFSGAWEKRMPGSEWEHDFDITYRRR